MNKIMKLPISLAWILLMVIVFTFVDYTWVFEFVSRLMFCILSLIGAGVLTAMNADLKFWKYKYD